MLSRRQHLLLLAPLLLVLVPFLLWPVLWGLGASVTNYAPNQPTVRFVGLRSYAAVLGDPTFRSSFRTILLWGLVALPVELALGLGIAVLLQRPMRGRALLRVVLLLPWLLSPIAHGVMWHYLLSSTTGMPNALLALLGLPSQPSPLGLRHWALPTIIAIHIWRTTPLVAFLLLPGLLAIPQAAWDHATVAGLPLGSQLRHVVLPALRPLLLAITLLLAGDVLGSFDSVLLLTGGGPGTATLTPALYSYQQAVRGQNWPRGTAAAWLIMAALVLIGGSYLALVRREET